MARKKKAKPNNYNFSTLPQKSPAQLVAELETLIEGMTEETYDQQIIDAYLNVLQQKEPINFNFDAEQSFQRFQEQHSLLFEDSPADAATYTPRKKARRRFHLRAAQVALLAFLIVIGGTATASAYGINIFANLVMWGEDILTISRSPEAPSGNMVLPEDSGFEYRSMADALEKQGIDSSGYITWIPVRYNLVLVDVQKEDAVTRFTALYQDEEGKQLLAFIEYAANPETVYTLEKNSGQVVYTKHGMEYYLAGNMDMNEAIWMDEVCYYTLAGDVTLDEIKYMLDSIER